MMNLILSGLVGMLLASTVVYKRRCNMYKKSYEQAMVLANQSIENATTAMEGYDMMKDLYESLKAEHSIICNNLADNPMCLVEANEAFDEVCDALENDMDTCLGKDGNTSVFITALGANLIYDKLGQDSYNHKTKDITISLFQNVQDKSEQLMYEYLNDKFGINLDINNIRTRIIFATLHELGHYVDFSTKEVSGELNEYHAMNYEIKMSIYDIEDAIEANKAYREMPAEAFADKWAIDFMIKHFPELV